MKDEASFGPSRTPLRILAVTLAAAVSSAGCHDWVAIRPAEVAKMQPSTASDGRPPQLERANGALVEIDHDSEVRFYLRGGKVYHFRHPVSARVEGESLIVRGGNAPDTNIPLQDIDKTEVRKFDGRATAGGIVVGVLAGFVLTYIVAKDQTSKLGLCRPT